MTSSELTDQMKIELLSLRLLGDDFCHDKWYRLSLRMIESYLFQLDHNPFADINSHGSVDIVSINDIRAMIKHILLSVREIIQQCPITLSSNRFTSVNSTESNENELKIIFEKFLISNINVKQSQSQECVTDCDDINVIINHPNDEIIVVIKDILMLL
jgi:hypothetical protein